MKSINYSLGNMKDCFRAALTAEKVGVSGKSERQHIPYRRTKLTMCLKDVFDSAARSVKDSSSIEIEGILCQVILVADLSPLRSAAKHNENTCSFLQNLLER